MELDATKSATVVRQLAVTGLQSRLQTKTHDFIWLALVGLCVAAVYLLLLPYIERTWRTTGDEPHYLLTAHSLVHDFDLDLTNNYNQFDYLGFYFSKDITRQVRYNPAGQEILNHYLGLPILIAPAYALGGRFGVLALQSILAGLLAAVTFKLAWIVSQNEMAALVGTLFVFFSPPFLFYPYLVYPELVAALLTTIILYCLITARLTNVAAMLVIVSLVILPWLNRRFIPLTLVLALLTHWLAWANQRSRGSLLAQVKNIKIGLIGITLTLISIGLLFWFNSQLSTPTRVDITLPTSGSLLWTRLARGIGWLVDQQRGLFVFAPVYILAVWSLPILARDFWRNPNPSRNRNWLLLLPFALSLGLTAVAGGFWVAWELGPRFLIVALPALAPLLALVWQTYQHTKLFIGASLLLFGISLLNGAVILRHPELPYKSSLPLFYSEVLNLSLTDWLPNLGDYASIHPLATKTPSSRIIQENGEAFWFVEAGGSTPIISATPLNALSFGHYQLNWPVRAEPGLPPETELLRLSIKHLGGGQVYYKTVTAADLPSDSTFGLIDESFFNPNPDRWRTAMAFQATSLGASNIWAGPVRIAPSQFYSWFLPYLVFGLIVASAIALWLRYGQINSTTPLNQKHLPTLPAAYSWSMALIVPIAALCYLGWQHNQTSHTYPADGLQHFVGQAILDVEAEHNRAWRVDPAIDPPQKAIYGPFDIYDAGQYNVTFRLKLSESVEAGQEVARLQVNATANFDTLTTTPLLAQDFSHPHRYQNFTVAIDNPRRQALSFEVYYLGVAPLVIDQVTISENRS